MSGVGSTKLAQIAIVTRDIERAIENYVTILGVPRPAVMITDPGNDVRATYRGQPTNAQAKLAFFDLGGVQLELIEPIGEDSAWFEGLDQRGEGVHHIAFWTEDMAAARTHLAQNGVPLIMRGDMGDGQYAYFDGQQSLGVMVELLEQRRTEIPLVD